MPTSEMIGVNENVRSEIGGTPQRRVRFEGVEVQLPRPNYTIASVDLEWQGDRYVGRFEGEVSPRHLPIGESHVARRALTHHHALRRFDRERRRAIRPVGDEKAVADFECGLGPCRTAKDGRQVVVIGHRPEV